jgi:hypothetical protein
MQAQLQTFKTDDKIHLAAFVHSADSAPGVKTCSQRTLVLAHALRES